MPFKMITAPTIAAEPLQVGDLSAWLAGPSDEQTADIQRLISAARQEAEQINGRVLAVSTWQLALDGWPDGDTIDLLEPLATVAPATSPITSFTYKTSAGVVTTMAASTNYIVDTDSRPGRISLPYGGSWPSATLWPVSPIKIQFTAGLAPADVSDGIKQYMKAFMQANFDSPALITTGRVVAVNPFVQNLARLDGLVRF